MSDQGRGLLRGCYWGETTRFGVLDIDKGSQYHNGLDLIDLTYRFARCGLVLTPYQSSESGGWHLYFYFDRYVLSQEVEITIKSYLVSQGYQIKSGTLEVFPSGNALRLPLQKGFGWLSDEGKLIRRREELTRDEALSLFLTNLAENQRDWSEAKSQMEQYIRRARASEEQEALEHQDAVSTDGMEQLFNKGLDWEKYQRGRQYWEEGLTGPGQRHDAVLCIGHYLWFGDIEAGLPALPKRRNAGRRSELILGWLKDKHNGHSKAVNAGQWIHIKGDVERACCWTSQRAITSKREPYPLTERLISRLCETRNLTPDDFELANARRELKARQKIHAALKEMLAEGQHPTVRGLAEVTGCSRQTIRRHSDIWGIYRVLKEARLSNGTGAYIAGGLGVIFGSVVLSAASSGSFHEVLEEEELKDPSSSSGDFGALVPGGPLNFPVAPLVTCLAGSLEDRAQNQAQALRVPSASLTLGPERPSIQAFRHGTAGGILLDFPVCYSDATEYGTGSRFWVCSKRGAQPSFWMTIKEKQTVSDATNCNFLTTIKDGFWSEKEDKFSGVLPGAASAELSKIGAWRSSSGAATVRLAHHEYIVDSRLEPEVRHFTTSKLVYFGAKLTCRQLWDEQYRHLVNWAARGPPAAHSALVLILRAMIPLVVLVFWGCAPRRI
jgi:hypothetical protein